MYKKVQDFTYPDLDSAGISNIITRMTSDVNQVQTGINMTLRLFASLPVYRIRRDHLRLYD